MIRQDDACNAAAGGNGYFERIAFWPGLSRTNQRQALFLVIHFRTQHKRGTPPSLFMSSLRIKRQPDEVAAVGNVGGHHHDSWPAGIPQSVSAWRFLVVICDTSWRNSYLRRFDRKTMLPSVARSSTEPIAFGEAARSRDRAGDPDSQAVAPLGNPSIVQHTYLHGIYIGLGPRSPQLLGATCQTMIRV